MKFFNTKSKSGFKIVYEKRQITDSEGYEMYEFKVPVLRPNKLDDVILFEVNLNNFYEELSKEIVAIKDGKTTLDDSILKLSNNWGYLRVKSHNVNPSANDSLGSLGYVLFKHQIKQLSSNESYGEMEYNFWKLLIHKVIPATKSWLQTYVRLNFNELQLSNLNDCIKDGVEVRYKSLGRTSYEVVPTTLLSAITMFSKTKRQGMKKSENRTCAYGPCNNQFAVNLGYGRARVTCSDSCRTLKAKHREKSK